MSTEKNKPVQIADDFADIGPLRLSQDFASDLELVRKILKIAVTKPNKQEWFRVHPEFRLDTLLFEDKIDHENYLIDRSLWRELGSDARPVMLLLCVNRQNIPFLWPVPLPGSDGRTNQWHVSAREAASMGKTSWIRIVANMSSGAYEIMTTTAELPEPQWPDMEFNEILRTAFKDRFIKDIDHPVIKRLRGAV